MTQRRRPRPEPRLERPVHVFDLWNEANELILEDSWRLHGHNAKTLEKRDDSCLILEAMKGGKTIARHAEPTSLQIHVLAGRLRVRLSERLIDLYPGQCLVLAPGIPHDITAVIDCTFTRTSR